MKPVLLLAALFASLAAASPALAYMGPGAGLGMLGSFFALVGAALIALFGLLILPVRLLLKWLRRRQPRTRVEPS